MKNSIKGLLIAVVLLLTVSIASFSFNAKTITTNANEYMGGNNEIDLAPRCILSIPNKTKLGKNSRGNVTCYDDSGLSDLEISNSDFQISGGLFKRIKILSISRPRTSDEKTYIWDFNYKATFFGNYTMFLYPASVRDINGNGSISSMTVRAKVSLF